jgi:hypothetical protein
VEWSVSWLDLLFLLVSGLCIVLSFNCFVLSCLVIFLSCPVIAYTTILHNGGNWHNASRRSCFVLVLAHMLALN